MGVEPRPIPFFPSLDNNMETLDWSSQVVADILQIETYYYYYYYFVPFSVLVLIIFFFPDFNSTSYSLFFLSVYLVYLSLVYLVYLSFFST